MYGKGLYGGVRRGNSRQMKKCTTRLGYPIWLDTSPKAFRRNGFEKIRHGDWMLDPNGDEAVAIGFARSDFGNKIVLWYSRLEDKGRVGYYSGSSPDDYQKIE